MSTATAGEMAEEPRDAILAIRRGFKGRCPHCGKGHVFRAYLKVRDACEICAEELHHHRADDAPPYLTILIVAHILGFAMVTVMSTWDDIPTWIEMVAWPSLVLGLSLLLLPRIKGALIGLQWAFRMHGFGGSPEREGV